MTMKHIVKCNYLDDVISAESFSSRFVLLEMDKKVFIKGFKGITSEHSYKPLKCIPNKTFF